MYMRVSEDERWVIKELRAAGSETHSVTVRLKDKRLTHIFVERSINDGRRIKDILQDSDYQDVTIKKYKGRKDYIYQKIGLKRH